MPQLNNSSSYDCRARLHGAPENMYEDSKSNIRSEPPQNGLHDFPTCVYKFTEPKERVNWCHAVLLKSPSRVLVPQSCSMSKPKPFSMQKDFQLIQRSRSCSSTESAGPARQDMAVHQVIRMEHKRKYCWRTMFQANHQGKKLVALD